MHSSGARWTWVAGLVLLLLTACSSNHYRLGMQILETGGARVEILGDAPQVVIRNEGPATLIISMTANEGVSVAMVHSVPAGEEYSATLSGPSTALLSLEGGDRAAVEVEIWSNDGLSVSGASVISSG